MAQCYGIIGDPIDHTLSPIMQEYWFSKSGLNARYQAFQVTRDNLSQAVSGLKALGVSGFNVTVPHKTAIIPFLDEIHEDARLIGAVNTVVHENGRLIGYNTDGSGFLKSLISHFPELPDQRPEVLVIGAGGAAKAVALTAAKYLGKRVDITNRTQSKAQQLSDACCSFCPSKAMPLADAEQSLDHYRLVINATSLGLYPEQNASPVHVLQVSDSALFVDLIYKPEKTVFLRQAENMGADILNGLPMLVYQGAIAFEKWTGMFPDVKNMEDYLQLRLNK